MGREDLLPFVCVLVYLCGCGTLFPVQLPYCVCVHMPVSLLVKGLFHLILFRSLSFERCVCVGKQRAPATHTNPHTHVASSTVLNLQAHTHHTQCRSQGSEAGQPEWIIVYSGNINLANVPKINLPNTIIIANLHAIHQKLWN